MVAKKKKFIIIDGNALIHRAWHALPPLKTRDGRVVNAVYGFTSILLKAMKDLKPDFMAVTFDLPAPTFRHEKFVEYKATREKQADELYEQFPIIKEIVRAFNIKIFEKAGFEADDVIGTLCDSKQVNRPDVLSVIVTGDMDTLQLIDNNTEVFTLKKGMSDTIIYNEAAVIEKFGGLSPSQMIDYKALRGDPSDNIPGIKGIGEKTAIELLSQFHSLDQLYAEIEKDSEAARSVKPRIRELLIDQKDQAYMSQDLSTIRRDVKIDFNLDDCAVKPYDQEKIFALFSDLDFQSLLNRLPGAELTQSSFFVEPSTKKNSADNYNLVNTDEQFNDFLDKLKQQRIFAFDTETSSLDVFSADLLGISFSWKSGTAYYVTITEPRLLALKRVFENKDIKKVAQNMKFDAMMLRQKGVNMENLYFDTMIASYLLNPGTRQHSLDNLAFTELQHKMIPITDLIGEGKKQISMAEVPVAQVSEYSCEDADYTWQLYEIFEARIKEEKLWKLMNEIEMPLIPVLIEMEFNGVKIDVEQLKALEKKVKRQIKTLQEKIYKLAGREFNINSPTQLKEILFNVLHISVEGIRHTKTGLSTAARELVKLRGRHEIIDLISDYRELAKLLSTYIKALPKLINKKTGRVHTSFNQTITATGRLSSSNPNLQNIPVRTELGREIRKAFIAEPGFTLVAADYSQVELRVIACLAKDPVMMEVFQRNEDIHRATAAKIFNVKPEEVTPEMRRKAKEVNFGVLYGMGSLSLAERTGISRAEAKEFIKKYFDSYKHVKEYTEKMVEVAREKGFVETLFGRIRKMDDIESSMPVLRAAAERMAVNMPIQGTAADLMKIAMIAVYTELKNNWPESRLLLQVHDELVLEVPIADVGKVAQVIDAKMEKIHKLAVPIKVDTEVGPNWEEMEQVQ